MAAYFVSTTGDDAQSGTKAKPFRTVACGIAALAAPGDVLNLRAGHYAEAVEVAGKHGTAAQPIVIRSYRGEHATIDGCLPQFIRAGNDAWVHVAEDEYASRNRIPLRSREDAFFRGAFFDREPYTRLITYDLPDDLRAGNETWDLEVPLTDAREGPEVVDQQGNAQCHKRPWVYMGPGFLVDPEGRIHIRLSHTHNAVRGLAEYEGETDPRRLALAICPGDTTTLTVRESVFVRFADLSIRFGGATTVKVESSTDVTFDHVRIMAAGQGVNLTRTIRTALAHCEVRGGLPPWFFRSDRKNEYLFARDGAVVENVLGKRTHRVLLDGRTNADVEIHHCEFVDGHDLVLPGRRLRFHHNWVHNLNDEALIVDEPGAGELEIFRNAITQCLSGISFARRNDSASSRSVHHNLFDLRTPTGSRRPGLLGDREVLRPGHLYKGKTEDGPLDFTQNTCLVRRVHDRRASYTHYENAGAQHPRRAFGNIFVAVNPDAASDRAIAILPSPDFPGPTDGNCYFRIGQATHPLLRMLEPVDTTFANLEAYRGSDFFTQSQAQHPPGYEASSIADDPLFRSIAADGVPSPGDDFRLRRGSPARAAGMGCYAQSARLRVGVDGRRQFPGPQGSQPFPPPL
ncbi:MAG: hypothetical protein ACXW5U_26020 [Thermoanaerobaculia bacterium]